MPSGFRLWLGCALAFAAPAFAQPAPRDEAIGSWILTCPAAPPGAKAEPCIMRHKDWVVPPSSGNPSAALEIQARGGSFVPAVALRGMPTQAALGGSLVVKPQVSFAYDNGPKMTMSCGLIGAAYACAPEASVVPAASAGLGKARSITVTVGMSIPGVMDLPAQQRTMDLAGINQALVRLAKVEVTDEALPSVPGLDLQAFLDKVLRAAGFQNGMGDILSRVMPLVGALRG